jgi:integrase
MAHPGLLSAVRTLISGWDVSRPANDLLTELDVLCSVQLGDERATENGKATRKATGKSMSRRSLQRGSLFRTKSWWKVRVWVDVPGQAKRAHPSFRVCKIKGPGSMTKPNREREAARIAAEKSAEGEKHLTGVVSPQPPVTGVAALQGPVTVREQGAIMLQELSARGRKPVADHTVRNYSTDLRLHVYPIIGDLPLSQVHNLQLKSVVQAMTREDYAKGSIVRVISMAKMVVASPKDPTTGVPLYPRKWDSNIIDLPVIDEEEMNTPCFTPEIMSGLALYHVPKFRMLFTFGGGAGARIAEMCAIEIDKHISPDFLTVTLTQQVQDGQVTSRMKHRSSRREVDLHPDIAARLKAFVGERKHGFLFTNASGGPLDYDNALYHLHSALKALNYVNPLTGTHIAGTHAFRRYRDTHLSNGEVVCPDGLLKYWMGHSPGKSMSALYNKIKHNPRRRREWAERCGYGFELPPLVLVVPVTAASAEADEAALPLFNFFGL